jgi:hypothetical protein
MEEEEKEKTGSSGIRENNNKFTEKQLFFMLLYGSPVVKDFSVLTLRAGLRQKT